MATCVALLGSCSDGGETGGTGGATGPGGQGTVTVVASFYPLQYITQRIGGDRVSVQNLTPTGAEPHEIELTAANTASVADADLVVYLSGFAPAVDDAVAAVGGDRALDVSADARLDLNFVPVDGGSGGGDDVRDPHFWLDPTRLADVADAVAARLATVDPADADLFTANAASLVADLHTLDDEYRTGLAECANRVIVTSHNAFGYLAEQYGLIQVGVTGLNPEDEPSPADLARVSRYVEQQHVTTIYSESLVSPAVAATVAAETGAMTAVLDPLEGLSDANQGSDYLDIMRADLATLRLGQGCT